MINIRISFMPVLMIAVLLSSIIPCSGQWVQPLHNFYKLSCYDCGESALFIGTDCGGIFTSSDNGLNWQSTNFGINKGYVYSVASIGDKVIAQTGEGLWKSNDRGRNWEKPDDNNKTFEIIKAMGNEFWASTYSGLFRSKDYGATWSLVLVCSDIESFAVIDKSVIVLTGDSVLVSSNMGSKWARSSLEPCKYDKYSLQLSGSIAYILVNNKIYGTVDGGKNWTQFPLSSQIGTINYFAVSGRKIYAAAAQGIFLSSDDGASWNAVSSGYPDGTPMPLQLTRWGTVLGFTDKNLYYSNDDGKNFRSVNSGLKAKDFTCSAVCSGKLFYGSQSGIYVSTDYGETWKTANGGLQNTKVNTFYVEGGNIYAGTEGGLHLSTNGGASWSRIDTLSSYLKFYALTRNADCLFAVAGITSTVYKSTDNGISWTASTFGLPNEMFSCLAAYDGVLYLGGWRGMYISTNNGNVWIKTNGVYNYSVNSIRHCSSIVYMASGSGLLYSSDKGAHWGAVNSHHGYGDCAFSGGDIISVSYYGIKIHHGSDSTDELKNSGLYMNFYNEYESAKLEIFGPYVFIFCKNIGFYRIERQALPVSVEEAGRGEAPFRLIPQPADDYLSIELPPGFDGARVCIADESGNICIDEFITNNYIDLRKLSSGLYFCTVSSGSRSYTRKFIITK